MGSRLRAVVEELANYKDSLASYGTTVPSDPPGEAHTKRYLLALGKVKDELIAEGTGLNYEDEIVYWPVHAAVDKEGPGKSSTPVDLVALYREFEGKYFNDAVPDLSNSFVCCFVRLPFDASGICYLEKDASRLGITQGIRINEKFREVPAEAKVALLHEMVHASSVRKHELEFKNAIVRLFGKGAYVDPLIL